MKGMPKTERERLQSGPIPGENFLSDTKNQPWHRAPKFKNLDQALDHVIGHVFEKDRAQTLMTVMEIGIPVPTIVSMYLQAGIGQGKWTPDFAILMAGPVAHIFRIMADGYDIKYDMGIEDNTKTPTKAFFQNMSDLKNNKLPLPKPSIKAEAEQVASDASANTQPIPDEAEMGGFMKGV